MTGWTETDAVVAVAWREGTRTHMALVSGESTLAERQTTECGEDYGAVLAELNEWLKCYGYRTGRHTGKPGEFARLGRVYAALVFPLARRV